MEKHHLLFLDGGSEERGVSNSSHTATKNRANLAERASGGQKNSQIIIHLLEFWCVFSAEVKQSAVQS